MRYGLLLIGCVMLAGAAGYAVCVAAGWNPHPRALLLAAAGCAIGAALAPVPMIWIRAAQPDTAAQLALLGTFVHLSVCAVAAAVAILGKLVPPMPFVGWLAAFYPASLLVLVMELIRRLRAT